MAADDLAMRGAKASATMILNKLNWDNCPCSLSVNEQE